jgi:hypothetical protein
MAERGGFSYGECVMLLGHRPVTWEPSPQFLVEHERCLEMNPEPKP